MTQQLDLNLLIALDVLLHEQSVTRAAERLELSVPAMSRTLTRIRDAMQDPILVRAGKGLLPTPRALEIRERVHSLAQEAQALFRFSLLPVERVERTFVVRAEDSLIATFAGPLVEAVRRSAPGIKLCFTSQSGDNTGALREGQIDLEIGSIKLRGPELLVQGLFLVQFVGVARQGHPLTSGTVDAPSFVTYDQVAASRRGLFWGPVDDALSKLGCKRNIVLVVPSFTAALAAVQSSELVAAMPDYYAQSAAPGMGLTVFRLPVQTRPVRISQAWHPRFDAEPVHRLVRECVKSLAEARNTRILNLGDVVPAVL